MGRVLVQLPGTTTAKALTETLSKNVIIVDEDLHQLRLHDGSTAGGHLIGNSAGSGVPVGTIIPFAGNSVPQGYLLCDGSAISRTTYASLFAVIGTIYGAGDGSTTFNLPNCNYYNPYHDPNVALGHYHSGYVPNITGYISLHTRTKVNGTATGAFYIDSIGTHYSGDYREGSQGNLGFDASRASDAYWNSRTVLAAGVNMNWIIKY